MKYENVHVKLKCVSSGCFIVSTGRGALLLPGKVKRFIRVLGSCLHLPRLVVSLIINLYLLEACVFFLLFWPFLLYISPSFSCCLFLSGMFSDGFFSYGIEPIHNGSNQVNSLGIVAVKSCRLRFWVLMLMFLGSDVSNFIHLYSVVG